MASLRDDFGGLVSYFVSTDCRAWRPSWRSGFTHNNFGFIQTHTRSLTAAGIAGFILSVGMAVDANILIFERMKEELKKGKITVGHFGRLQSGVAFH